MAGQSAPTLSLKKIMDEPTLMKGFADFCRIQHASENVEFWLAVDIFRESFRDSSDSPVPGSPLSPARKSGRRTFWASIASQGMQRIGSAKSLAEEQAKPESVTVLTQATKIYRDFLAPNADKWVCVDQIELDEIKRKLDSGVAGIVDYKVFDTVQKQVFTNMEKDLLPRFSRTFELDETPTVFQNPQSMRGSVRFVPDQKLRATLVKTSMSSD